MKKYPFTTNGFKQLKEELVQLKEKRKAVSKAIGEARELGDLKENAEYHAAKEEQRLNEERINLLERYHAQAEIIDTLKLKDDGAVVFGSFVEVVDLDNETTISFQIVGEYEANISKGLLSISSPIARAILRKEEGDIALVETPNGQKEYEVTRVSLHPLSA